MKLVKPTAKKTVKASKTSSKVVKPSKTTKPSSESTPKMTRLGVVTYIRESGRNPAVWFDNKDMRSSMWEKTLKDTGDFNVPKNTPTKLFAILGATNSNGAAFVRVMKCQVHGKYIRLFEPVYVDYEVRPGEKFVRTDSVANLNLIREEYGANNVIVGDDKTVKKFIAHHSGNGKRKVTVHPKVGAELMG